MFLHALPKRRSGAMKAHRRAVYGNVQRGRRLRDGRLTEINHRENGRVRGAETLHQFHAASAGLVAFYRCAFDGSFDQLDQASSARACSCRVRDDVPVNAVEPGQRFIRIFEQLSFLHRVQGSELEDVINVRRGYTGTHEGLQLDAVVPQRLGDNYQIACVPRHHNQSNLTFSASPRCSRT